MKKLLLSASLLFSVCFSQAQSAQSIFVELGGPGLASINFDSRFNGREDGIGGRIGFGGFTVDGETALFFPLEVNYLLGKDRKNYFEIGAGATPTTISGGGLDDPFTGTFGHLYFGYRLQPANGGFLFKAGIVPIFGHGYFIPYYFGIGFGYKFDRRK